MRIRPGDPDDIAAVLALGDEAVAWMNARGNTQQWGTAPWTGSQGREAAVRDQAHGGGMRIAAYAGGIAASVAVLPFVTRHLHRIDYGRYVVWNEAAEVIRAAATDDTNIIFGATIDGRLTGQLWITVIATGIGETRRSRTLAAVGTDFFDAPSFLSEEPKF